MPRRHVFQHVTFPACARPSARRLDRALIALGYSGPTIRWGTQGGMSKRRQLEVMREAGVPVPLDALDSDNFEALAGKTLVARTDDHRAGSGFWLCDDPEDLDQAIDAGATHAMEYIQGAREFRVHIVDGKSIKLTEKLHEELGESMSQWHTLVPVIRSHAHGWRHMLPRPEAHRLSLRAHAKAAVQALRLTHGAVDILMREEEGGAAFYVLEVNTAPGFAGETDTCERYARAFAQRAQPHTT